ncbi:unnamed protein product [Linum trigynum]|uniref:Uncharacterized protein n=1 Tax=Linum trigynum TaxID=586398 RepID=A0AAV2CVW1_9ROSI
MPRMVRQVFANKFLPASDSSNVSREVFRPAIYLRAAFNAFLLSRWPSRILPFSSLRRSISLAWAPTSFDNSSFLASRLATFSSKPLCSSLNFASHLRRYFSKAPCCRDSSMAAFSWASSHSCTSCSRRLDAVSKSYFRADAELEAANASSFDSNNRRAPLSAKRRICASNTKESDT